MRGIQVILVCWLWAALAGQSHASAWNPEAGQGEVITAFVLSEADEAVDDVGVVVPLDTYQKRISQTFATIGLTDRIAAVGTFDWQDTEIVGDGVDVSFSKPSTLSAGLQYQLSRREGHALAISASYTAGIDLPDALLTVDSRKDAVELRGLWGESRTVMGRNAFAEVQLAARMERGGRYAGTQAQLSVGAEPTDSLLLLAKGRFTQVESGTFEGRAVPEQRRWELDASAVWRVGGTTRIELGYGGVVSARSAVRERGVKIGLWKRF